jgi:hypothetical protein
VNLFNATLVSLADRTTNPEGKVMWAAATSLNARCTMSDVEQRQRVELGAEIADATGALRVLKRRIPGVKPLQGQKAVIAVDGSDALAYRVVYVRDWEKRGGLAHWECFLQQLPQGEQ